MPSKQINYLQGPNDERTSSVTRLNQIVAIVKGEKERVNKLTAPLFHSLDKPVLFAGLTQTYRPRNEEDEQLPPDNTDVVMTVPEVLSSFEKSMVRLLDVIATAERTNTDAFADVVVDGNVIIERAPVTLLMQLEKILEREVRGLIIKLPVLDPAETWLPSESERRGMYETPTFMTIRNKKVARPLELAPATDRHPAQVQLVTEDVVAGYWDKKKFSGAVPAAVKQDLLERVDKLINAVKFAREEANSIDVVDFKIGRPVFSYLFS